ncbi:MAG: glycosyltransferase [Bacteroidia bacterium]
MSSEVFFSIVIPTYNRAAFINATVQSVLQQTYTNFEVIVVDDGSTDNTEEVINKLTHPRLFYFKKENAERGAARNFGVRKAKGDYITFLDSDDLLMPHHFAIAADFIKENKQPEIFHHAYNFINEDGVELQRLNFTKGDFNKQLIVKGNLMSCMGVFLRNDIAKQFPFNEDYALSGTEDHELWLRLAARYEIKHLNTVTASLVQHDTRSVMEVNPQKLIQRLELFIKYVSADKAFQKKYGLLIPAMKAQAWSYIALHFALTHSHYKEGMEFFKKAFKVYPEFIFQKRFYVIAKHLMQSK